MTNDADAYMDIDDDNVDDELLQPPGWQKQKAKRDREAKAAAKAAEKKAKEEAKAAEKKAKEEAKAAKKREKELAKAANAEARAATARAKEKVKAAQSGARAAASKKKAAQAQEQANAPAPHVLAGDLALPKPATPEPEPTDADGPQEDTAIWINAVTGKKMEGGGGNGDPGKDGNKSRCDGGAARASRLAVWVLTMGQKRRRRPSEGPG